MKRQFWAAFTLVMGLVMLAPAGSGAAAKPLPGTLTIEMRDGGGLSAGERDTLPRDLRTGMGVRLQERGIDLDGSAGMEWQLTGEISRMPDYGPYVWTLALSQKRAQRQELVCRWVGTAASPRALTFYRGTTVIDWGGLVGEMARRVAAGIKGYETDPVQRLGREFRQLASDITTGDPRAGRLRVETQLPSANPSAASGCRVTAMEPGRLWVIALAGGRSKLLSEDGIGLKAKGATQLALPADVTETWLLYRLDRIAGQPRLDLHTLQGDELVSVLEMRPGFGEVDTGVLNLLDQMRKGNGGAWLLKRVAIR